MKLKVKDTYISTIKPGDFILHTARGLENGDVLGEIIAKLEGGIGRYTHAAGIRDVPDPETPVIEVRPGVFKVIAEKEYIEPVTYETPFHDVTRIGEVLRSDSGVKLEATWPKCQEWPIDWEHEGMEVWRVRGLSGENISDVLRAWQDMAGTEPFDSKRIHPDAYDYNVAEFLSFGLLKQAAAKICSEFVAEPYYNSTLFRGCALGNYPIALTPNLAGIRDPQITPNDLALNMFAYRVRHQGVMK